MDAVWNYEDIYIVYTEKNCHAGLGRRFFMYDSVVLVLSFDWGQKKKKKKKKRMPGHVQSCCVYITKFQLQF